MTAATTSPSVPNQPVTSRDSKTKIVATKLGKAILPVAIALLIGGVVLRLAGIDPFAVYWLMLTNAFGTASGIAGTLTAATPLLFTGLGTAIAFRAGVFSIGAESGFVLGGLAAAWLAALLPWPPWLVIVTALVGGFVAGALFSVPAALLKVKLGVDEVVSTLMLNFVAAGIAAWLVNSYLLAPGSANSSTRQIPFDLWKLIPPSTLNVGLIIAIAMIAGYALVLRRTSFGFELHNVGVNERFASAQGVRISRVIFTAMILTGAISGIGGAIHAMGVVGKFVVGGFSASYGFTGIAVALLARRSPLAIIPAAILFGAFASAGTTIQLFDNIPLDLVDVLQGTVMMFAVASFVFDFKRRRKIA